jgi:multidrug efflux pump subunit AcrB
VWLIRLAMRRPISVIVVVIGVALCSILAIERMRIDIFPDLDLPVIYVAQPYGGMSPQQMEGYLVYYYEYHFLYINGIESVESKSVQGAGLLKLTFHPGTDMSEALAQTISYVNRARAFMPPGTVSPFVVRYDAGTVPVGYLVFSSATRSVGEIQDLALNRVRPVFATLPGVTSPPPFGGNQRTIVINVNPDKLRAYNMSPDEVVKAISSGNIIMPAGSVQMGDLQRIVPMNSVVADYKELLNLPIRTGAGPAVFVRDVGTVDDSTDILAGYALVNGRRSVYIPVTKRPAISTLSVVADVKRNLERFKSLVPPDIDITYEFDQSGYVKGALTSVVREGLLGAALVGLMVLIFLGDWRSSLIVITTIPLALLAAVVSLWAAGQTINIMTLGGLALAVGVLVDEATVEIENIHVNFILVKSKARAVVNATSKTVIPRFLSMVCILAVFVPSFFMTGVAKSLFVPLSLAVGFAMVASYALSGSLVPVMCVWILKLKQESEENSRLERLRRRLGAALDRGMRVRWLVVGAYIVVAALIIAVLGPRVGRELFPRATAGQFQLHFRAPVGTRVAATEQLVIGVLGDIGRAAGAGNVAITLGYVGLQASSYPINTVYLWTSGPQDAVINVSLTPAANIRVEDLEERLRQSLPQKYPGCLFSFQAGDIVGQIMNFGAPTVVEVAVMGGDLPTVRGYVEKVRAELARISALRDLQYEQPLDYPSMDVNVNRVLAGQMGVTVEEVGRALVAATSSSRFVTPNYWADPRTGVSYQVQVQIPQPRVNSVEDLQTVPVTPGGAPHPLVGDVAIVSYGSVIGEYDRVNGQFMVSLSANVAGSDLGRAANEIDQAIARAGAPPRGVTVVERGQIAPMRETLTNLGIGLLVAVLVVFLLLSANFESMRLSFVVVSTIPIVLCGVILGLLATGTTLNVQSFMGAILAIGVALANAILLVSFAEGYRREGMPASDAAVRAAQTRLRPVLMTSLAMTAGMLPMALALGEGAEATAPLGRAVIGGLVVATIATLTILPLVFAMVQGGRSVASVSLDPDDPESRYADAVGK